MKVICPECKEYFDLSINEYDEGDDLECPECTIGLMVVVQGGRLKVKTEKQQILEEESEFDQYYEDDA